MALGTLDRTPPPFFKQGPSAFTRLVFFSSLALFLMVADVRFKVTQPLRAGAAILLHPVQQALLAPARWVEAAGDYFAGLDEARAARSQAERTLAAQAELVMRAGQLAQENAALRAMLDLRPRLQVQSQAAEVLYDAPDPYTRKVLINLGSTQGAVLGSPVLDQHGVLGQITRVYPLTSEVTLVTDRDAAVPVVNGRNSQRGVVYGTAQADAMELRFMAGNADVQVGDLLSTSGLDGIYPSGLPVARVTHIDRRADSAFARISLVALSQPDSPRHVLVLRPLSEQLPYRPTESAPRASSAEGASNPLGAASRVSTEVPR